jgi:hypothetical protein
MMERKRVDCHNDGEASSIGRIIGYIIKHGALQPFSNDTIIMAE